MKKVVRRKELQNFYESTNPFPVQLKHLLRSLLYNLKTENLQPEMFCKKGVLKNFTNLAGKHQCWSLFLIKLEA